MSTIKIEKGIPIPPKHDNEQYPFAEMEVGDSFVFNVIPGKDITYTVRYLNVAIFKFKKSVRNIHKAEFICRRINNESVRCWRTK